LCINTFRIVTGASLKSNGLLTLPEIPFHSNAAELAAKVRKKCQPLNHDR